MKPVPGRGREPVWVSRVLLDAIHAALIEQYGGSHGIHDEALIDSAAARPQNLFGYIPESDVPALAASLCYGLAKNRGFRDGNKRTAFAAAAVFIGLNGMVLTARESDAVIAMVYVATDEWDEQKLAAWIRENLRAAG